MSMGEKKSISLLVTGGEATAGPPLGPAIGPLGVNVMAVVNRINELTREYSGMRVPVVVNIDVETKQFDVEVGVPTTSALIAKEAKIEKGSGAPNTNYVGNLTMAQVVKIARLKRCQSYGKTLKSLVKEVLGSCVSMGVKVEGKNPKEIIKEVDQGLWDSQLKDIQ